jgi:LuxR family maltose regulon positive regulatory protein
MSESILLTKLYIPPLRPGLIRRPRLLEMLDNALQHRLTLLSAPAGFGKTTLLSDWAHHVEAPVTWVTLDQGDNEPARFLSYLVAALHRIDAGTGHELEGILQGMRTSPVRAPEDGWDDGAHPQGRVSAWVEQALVRLINELLAVPGPFVLVLDDYHLISSPSVHEMVRFLLDHLPPPLHVIVSSRADPPLSLSRWRGRGHLNELRTADLRFTQQEVAAYLGGMAGLALSASEIAAIEARTEGWITGLQMAALSMRDRDTRSIGAFIDAFAGSNRYVLDYLTDEVLSHQPRDVQRFLLCTSVVERFTGALCDALLADAVDDLRLPAGEGGEPVDSQQVIKYLDRSNLFVVSLDDRREWYRYHRLFGELLQRRLRATEPELEATLLQRASAWHERQGTVADAVRYAIAAHDVERVVRLIEHNIGPMLDRGELTVLARWLEVLPDEQVAARPWLGVAYAWILAYAGRLDDAEALLRRIEASPAYAPSDAAGAQAEADAALSGHLSAIRAYAAWEAGEHARAARLAQAALAELRPEDRLARGLAAGSLGAALLELGDLVGAECALREAIDLVGTETHIGLLAVPSLADTLARQGRLVDAAAVCRTVLDYDERYVVRDGAWLPATGNTFGMMSIVLRRWNELDAAAEMARQGVRLGEQWGQADTMTFCAIQLAYNLAALGDAQGAREAVERAGRIAASVSTWFTDIVESTAARIGLSLGDTAAAERWARARAPFDDPPSYRAAQTHELYAWLLLAQGQLPEARAILEPLFPLFEAARADGQLVGLLALYALVLEGQGEQDAAAAALVRTAAMAAPERQVRVFLDLGAPMQRLLARVAESDPSLEPVRSLLAAFAALPHGSASADVEGGRSPARAVTEDVLGPLPAVIEALTEREHEVLDLIAAGLTNREIGERLYIAAGTVKAHTASIYSKLDVHSRTQAVARAQALGILTIPG